MSSQEQVLAGRRELLGERHPDTLGAMNNLAEALSALGELEAARELEEQVLAGSRSCWLGEPHPEHALPRGATSPGR